MTIKQLSVFLENTEGRLNEVMEVLAQNGINIIALSLADAAEYGMLRMMVSEPEKGKKALKENGFSVMLTDVVCIKVDNKAGSLSELLKMLMKGQISIEYMYAFATKEEASIVMKISEPEKAVVFLEENHFEMWLAEDLYQL